MNPPYVIELFGGLHVRQGDQTITRFRTQKTGVLLAYLACYLRRTHPREELIDMLWPEADLEAGRMNLRTALASLRRQLEPAGAPENSVIVADRTNVQLNPDRVSTDLETFERQAQSGMRTEDPSERAKRLLDAIELYRGPLLPAFYEDWVLRERGRLEQAYIGILRHLVSALEQTGDLVRAIEYAHRVVNVDPLREESHYHLIRLSAEAGQPAAALRYYNELKSTLARELGEVPSPATSALAERLSHERKAGRVPDAPVALRSRPAVAPVASTPRLPLQLTRFFGREEELAYVQQMLSSGNARLLTLTGSGGSGKTRLAVEAARQLQGTFAGAIWFVPLADTADPRLIAGVILEAMGIPRSAETEPLEYVAEALCRQPSLLVLDNFEQLADDGAQVVWTLLERIPTLSCLVTSRQRLNVGGERELSVKPLPVPTLLGTPEHMAQYPSIQLFVDRGQATRPDFQITPENSAIIVALCERLEGIPLAIELAAAWIGTLTLAQILARLKHRLEFLSSRRKDLLPRHRTLWATVEWSFRLLSPELQRFFAGISVFQGGWSLEAAEIVCEEPEALDYLYQLRDRSLIVAEETGSEMRFRLLETLREFIGGQLSPAERDGLAARHLDFFVHLACEARPHLHGPEQSRWLERLEQEHDNFRAALEWSGLMSEYVEKGLRLAGHLYFFWNVRGHFAEGYRRLSHLLTLDSESGERPMQAEHARTRSLALLGAGELAFAQGNIGAAQSHFEESLPLWRSVRDRKGLADSLCFLGLVRDQNDHGQARALLEESRALYQEIGDRGGLAHALKCLGVNARVTGEPERARALFQEGFALYRELGNSRGANMMLGEMAHLALNHGDYGRAETLLREHLSLSQELKDIGHTASALWHLGNVLYGQGDYSTARSLYSQCLSIYRELGNRSGIVIALNRLGAVAMEQSDFAAARSLYQESLTLARELEDRVSIASALDNLGRIAHHRGDYDAAYALHEESLALWNALGDRWGITGTLRNLGNVAADRGDAAAAQTWQQKSLALARELGDRHGVSMALYNLGDLARQQGDRIRARALWEECLALDQELGIKGGSVLGALGTLAAEQGEFDEAHRLWWQSLRMHREIGDRKGVAECLEGLAAVAAMQVEAHQRRSDRRHDPSGVLRSVRLYAAADRLREVLGSPLPPERRLERDRRIDALRAALDEPAIALAWSGGRAMSPGEAVRYALGETDPTNG